MKIKEVFEGESIVNILKCKDIDEKYDDGKQLVDVEGDEILNCVVQSKIRKHSSMIGLLREMFLPSGYPDSVSKDYVSYQLWDTIQALSSSLTGVLSTRAILRGYGVGNSAASVGSAVLQWILRDGAGMIGRIYFAWRQGRQLDCNAKTWRFMADILNDIGMTLEMLSPLSETLFLPLSVGGIISKSICGVAGGATKASLTMHFAQRDNLADVSAKDGSQETAVGLIGMFLGAALTASIPDTTDSSSVYDSLMIWILFFVLIAFHLYCNYRAVTGVTLTSINRYRATLIYRYYQKHRSIPTPSEISKQENVLLRDDKQSIHLGCSLEDIIKLKQQINNSGIKKKNDDTNNNVKSIKIENRNYLIWKCNNEIYIALKESVRSFDLIESYFYSLSLYFNNNEKDILDLIKNKTLKNMLLEKGWNLDRMSLDANGWRYNLVN